MGRGRRRGKPTAAADGSNDRPSGGLRLHAALTAGASTGPAVGAQQSRRFPAEGSARRTLAPAFSNQPVGDPTYERQDEDHDHEFARGEDDQFTRDHRPRSRSTRFSDGQCGRVSARAPRLSRRPDAPQRHKGRWPSLYTGHSTPSLRNTGRAMARENVEIVRQVFEAFNTEEIERVIAFMHPDVVVEIPAEVSTEPDTYRGPEGMRRYLGTFQEAMDEIRFQPERFWEAGQSVVVALLLTAKGRQTAIAVEQRSAGVWRIRDGAVIGVRVYASQSEALEAVGLAE